MDCEPVFDYGRSLASWEYTGESYHQGVATAVSTEQGSDVRLTLTTDMSLGFEGGHAGSRTLLPEGEVRFVAFSWGGAQPPTTNTHAHQRLIRTPHPSRHTRHPRSAPRPPRPR